MTTRPELNQVIEAMLDPGFYPERPSSVELLQTQMSFVFLAGDFAYKVKKPVDLGYLDYSTLEKRRFFCERELELNRRLCPNAYLGVYPIFQTESGFSMSGNGEAVEYVLKMKRLAQDRMLDVLLKKEEVSPETMERIAGRVVAFHEGADTSAEIDVFGDVSTIRRNTEENFDQTEKTIGLTISPSKFERIRKYTRGFIEDNVTLLQGRVSKRKIRDCHGDLHSAHVCLENGICIFDCIEFNDRFRYGDVASEVAFLAMDLDHYGRADLSYRFVSSYVNLIGDNSLFDVLTFYKCYRAYVRGKVESFKLDDRYIAETEKLIARRSSSGYFDLASFYVRPRPTLFITVGVTGTGKSTIAGALSQRLGVALISSDVVRKQLAGIPPKEHRYNEFQVGMYSAEFSKLTYDTMLVQARELLKVGVSVILDATFIKASDRLAASSLATECQTDFFVLECVAPESMIRERLAKRLSTDSVSDGRVEIMEPQLKAFDPVTEVGETAHIVIDMSRALETNIDTILDKIGEV